jgi:hypothetical protein
VASAYRSAFALVGAWWVRLPGVFCCVARENVTLARKRRCVLCFGHAKEADRNRTQRKDHQRAGSLGSTQGLSAHERAIRGLWLRELVTNLLSEPWSGSWSSRDEHEPFEDRKADEIVSSESVVDMARLRSGHCFAPTP